MNLKRTLLSMATAAVLSLSLSACQSTMEGQGLVTDQSYWQGMQQRLQSIKFIDMAGRVSFAHQSDRFSANFRYKGRNSSNYELIFTSSFGKVIAHLTVTPEKAYLQTDKHQLEASNAKDLFRDALKMELPLEHFHALALGMVLNDNGHSVLAPAGFVTNSMVDQFTINYLDYQSFDSISIPSEFEITAPDLRITVKTRDVFTIERGE